MLTFLKTALVIAGMVMIIPLAIWGMTGSLRQAWYALKQYLLVMAFICVPGVLFGLIAIIPHLF